MKLRTLTLALALAALSIAQDDKTVIEKKDAPVEAESVPVKELDILKLENTQLKIQMVTTEANSSIAKLQQELESLRVPLCEAAKMPVKRCRVNFEKRVLELVPEPAVKPAEK